MKNARKKENDQNTDSFLGTIWPSTGPKTAIFPNALFLHFPWDLPTIFAGGPIPNAKKGTFSPEVLIQRS